MFDKEMSNKNRYLIKNVNILDGKGNKYKNSNLIIKGNIIESITHGNQDYKEIKSINLNNRWIMPGMIDLHVHLCSPIIETRTSIPFTYWRMITPPALKILHAAKNAYRTLMAGFTTLRNCGHVTYYEPEDVALREGISQGIIEGPRIIASAGSITMTAGHGDLAFNKKLHRIPELRYGDSCFDGKEECLKGVREKIRLGADFIKIMASGGMSSGGDQPEWPNFTVDELKVMVNEAHSLGKKVAAHAQGKLSIERVLKVGVDTLEHGCQLNRKLCGLMASKGVFLVPTLRVVSLSTNSKIPYERESAKRLAESHRESVKIAIESGVKIAFGTDTFNDLLHGENAQELIFLSDVGMSNMELIKCVTYNAAKALGLQDFIGYIGEGAIADLIVTDNDPSEDIGNLTKAENIKLVIKNGKLVKPKGKMLQT